MTFLDFTARNGLDGCFFRIVAFGCSFISQKLFFHSAFLDDAAQRRKVSFEDGNTALIHVGVVNVMDDFMVFDESMGQTVL